MLKYGKIKLFCKKDKCRFQFFNSYKSSLSSKVAYLQNNNNERKVSNLDCDFTTIDNKCILSFIHVNDIPMNIEICYSDHEACEIIESNNVVVK